MKARVLLIDFMPIRGKYSDLVRIVRGLRGKVQMCMELVLRFDYGLSVPWVKRLDDGSLRAIAGPDMVVLRTDAPLRGENMKTVSEFSVAEGRDGIVRAHLCSLLWRSPQANQARA